MKTLNPLASTASGDSLEVTTAGSHSLDDTSICNICGRKMRRMTVSYINSPMEAYVCLEDRIALPVKDEN